MGRAKEEMIDRDIVKNIEAYVDTENYVYFCSQCRGDLSDLLVDYFLNNARMENGYWPSSTFYDEYSNHCEEIVLWEGCPLCSSRDYRVTRVERIDVIVNSCPGSVVYFIQAGKDHPIKIGMTNNAQSRLKNLQVGHYDKLRIIHTITGGRKEEAALHEKFAHLRIQGEWFKPERELLQYIINLMGDKP
jgi:hypothetical protein